MMSRARGAVWEEKTAGYVYNEGVQKKRITPPIKVVLCVATDRNRWMADHC